MSQFKFKTIRYKYMIKETLRELCVNKAGYMSYLYKLCLGGLYAFQSDFDDFHSWRLTKKIIANCKWQVGQLTNTLNYLFDNDQKRIYISQATYNNVFAPKIASIYSGQMCPKIDSTTESTVFAPKIASAYDILALVTFHIPSDLYNDAIILEQITSTIEQIRIDGINYIIVEI